jgi:hypothetical protein
VAVYGSYLTDTPKINDIDVYVELIWKEDHPWGDGGGAGGGGQGTLLYSPNMLHPSNLSFVCFIAYFVVVFVSDFLFAKCAQLWPL